MKSSLVLASALATPLCFSTAIAGDNPSSFHALDGLSSAHVVAMTNDQLATVEGGVVLVNRPNNAQGACTGTANCISVIAVNVAIGGTANQNSGGVFQQQN